MTASRRRIPPAPKHLRPQAAGRALLKRLEAVYEAEHASPEGPEVLLLHQAAAIADRLAQLREAIAERGVIGPDGKVNPALVEERQQGEALRKTLVSLHLPIGLPNEDGDRLSVQGHRAQRAAEARWNRPRAV